MGDEIDTSMGGEGGDRPEVSYEGKRRPTSPLVIPVLGSHPLATHPRHPPEDTHENVHSGLTAVSANLAKTSKYPSTGNARKFRPSQPTERPGAVERTQGLGLIVRICAEERGPSPEEDTLYDSIGRDQVKLTDERSQNSGSSRGRGC